jgi:ubiquinone/menaquinone biosynthesis C-methylase UbiE
MSVFETFSLVSRKRKLQLFNAYFAQSKKVKILDVGSEINFDGKNGLQFIDTYPYKYNITALNISQEHVDNIKKNYPDVTAVVGNACELPYTDKSFDIVFSNERQKDDHTQHHIFLFS